MKLTKPAFSSSFQYVLLMSEAIVALTGENVWSRKLTRRSNSHLHWMFQLVGAGFSIVGVLVIYVKRSSHFRSYHSLIGGISVGCMSLIVLSGLPALFAAKLRKLVRPVLVKGLHNCLGIAIFVSGIVAQILGYDKFFMRSKTSGEMIDVLIVTTAMIAVFSLIGSLRSLWEQLKGICRCS